MDLRFACWFKLSTLAELEELLRLYVHKRIGLEILESRRDHNTFRCLMIRAPEKVHTQIKVFLKDRVSLTLAYALEKPLKRGLFKKKARTLERSKKVDREENVQDPHEEAQEDPTQHELPGAEGAPEGR